MSEVFEQDEFHSAYPPGIERHFWNLARNKLILRWLSRELAPGDLVMDVGCATGIAVQSLNESGINIRGVETGDAPVIESIKELVMTGVNLFDLDQETRNQVKAVLLLDVLEHMEDREEFLRRLSLELPNCRNFLITVPARQEIWSNYDAHYGHYLRYDRPTLRQEVEAAGLSCARISYFFNWLYLASLILKWTGLEKGTEFTPLPSKGIKPLLHRALAFITEMESRIMPSFVAGSSMIALVRSQRNSI